MPSYTIPPDLQVYGAGYCSMVEGFGAASLLASRILQESGVGDLDEGGLLKIKSTKWYPYSGVLRAYARIERELGANLLYQVGLSIPKHAIFPLGVHDVEGALRSINIAYYINHGLKNEPLFEASTGKFRRRIGEYRTRRDGERRVLMECENAYPCELDHGIIETVAKKFEPTAKVLHDKQAPCRRRQNDFCAYSVEW